MNQTAIVFWFFTVFVTGSNLALAEGLPPQAAICEFLVMNSSGSQDPTDRWIAAMERLHDLPDVLTPQQYRAWTENLSSGEAVVPENTGGLSSTTALWMQGLEVLRRSGDLDWDRIRAHAARLLLQTEAESSGRIEVQKTAALITVRAHFVDTGIQVSALELAAFPNFAPRYLQKNLGEYEFKKAMDTLRHLQGDDRIRMAARLGVSSDTLEDLNPAPEGIRLQSDPHPEFQNRTVEVMDTPFTQWMWVRLLGGNPAKNSADAPDHMILNGVHLLADHPVEDVNLNDILLLLIYLNDPETSLRAKREVIPDHRPGDWYNLPTPQILSQLLDLIDPVDREKMRDLNRLHEFAWFWENSSARTQRVRSLEPLHLNGHEIFDFLGNVTEVAVPKWGWGGGPAKLWSANFGMSFKSFGGDAAPHMVSKSAQELSKFFTHSQSPAIGFRLIRVRQGWRE